MKLFRETNQRRLKARDVIFREEQAALDFDPHRDFPPEELARLKRLARTEHEKTTLPHDPVAFGWWLKFVDEEFAQDVQRQPGLKQDLKDEFVDYMRSLERSRLEDGKWLDWCVPVIQVFPELRPIIIEKYVDGWLPYILKAFGPDHVDVFETMFKLLPLVQLYPERRTEFLDLSGIHPNEVVGLVTEAMNSKGKLFSENKLLLASHMILLFPQLRSEILAILSPKVADWVRSFKQTRQPFEHPDYETGFDLLVLSAHDARINSSGDIELELRPPTLGKDSPQLPARSLL